MEEEEAETARISIATTLRLELGLKETACFHVHLRPRPGQDPDAAPAASSYNESLMYTLQVCSDPIVVSAQNWGKVWRWNLQYQQLEDHHPIRQRYELGVPQVRSHCICDCPGGDRHCRSGSRYAPCTRAATDNPAACFTTYHPDQSPIGCPSGSNTLSPLFNQLFSRWQGPTPHSAARSPSSPTRTGASGPSNWACRRRRCGLSAHPFHLPRSTGKELEVATFVLRLWSQERAGRWRAQSVNTFSVPLDSRQDRNFTLGRDRIRLALSGSNANRYLAPGLPAPFPIPPELGIRVCSGQYLVKEGESRLRTNVQLNDEREWDMEKLGWFRRQNGSWEVRHSFQPFISHRRERNSTFTCHIWCPDYKNFGPFDSGIRRIMRISRTEDATVKSLG